MNYVSVDGTQLLELSSSRTSPSIQGGSKTASRHPTPIITMPFNCIPSNSSLFSVPSLFFSMCSWFVKLISVSWISWLSLRYLLSFCVYLVEIGSACRICDWSFFALLFCFYFRSVIHVRSAHTFKYSMGDVTLSSASEAPQMTLSKLEHY